MVWRKSGARGCRVRIFHAADVNDRGVKQVHHLADKGQRHGILRTGAAGAVPRDGPVRLRTCCGGFDLDTHRPTNNAAKHLRQCRTALGRDELEHVTLAGPDLQLRHVVFE